MKFSYLRSAFLLVPLAGLLVDCDGTTEGAPTNDASTAADTATSAPDGAVIGNDGGDAGPVAAKLVWTRGTISGAPSGVTFSGVEQIAVAKGEDGNPLFVALVGDKAFGSGGAARYTLVSRDGKAWTYIGPVRANVAVSASTIVAGPTVVSEQPTTVRETVSFFGVLPDGQGMGGSVVAGLSASAPALVAGFSGFGQRTLDIASVGFELRAAAGKFGANGALSELVAVGTKGNDGTVAVMTSLESTGGVLGGTTSKELPPDSVLGRAICATGNGAGDPFVVVGDGAYAASTPRLMTLVRSAPGTYDVKTPARVEGDDDRNTSSKSFLSVACGANEQIAVGRGNAVVVSKDKGTSWKLTTATSSQIWSRIVKVGAQYVLVGGQGAYAVTSNGESLAQGLVDGSDKIDFASAASSGSLVVAGSAVLALRNGGEKVDAQIWWANVAP